MPTATQTCLQRVSSFRRCRWHWQASTVVHRARASNRLPQATSVARGRLELPTRQTTRGHQNGHSFTRDRTPRPKRVRSWRESGVASRVAAHGRLLAGRELPVGRADLPIRQSAAAGAVDARACQAAGGGALGYDAGSELHLRPPEPRDQSVRPRHVLHRGPWPRRPGVGGQHVSGGQLQRDLPQHQPGRSRVEEAVHAILLPGRHIEPRGTLHPGLDPRGR